MNGPRERDRSIETWLRQSLETLPAGVTDACLDAEQLAAWSDGGLSGAEREAAEVHVADCARCQAMAATLARVHSAAPAAVAVPASRRWLAWFVPLTAVATATVALLVSLPFRYAGTTNEPTAVQTLSQDAVGQPPGPPAAGAPAQAEPAPPQAQNPAASAEMLPAPAQLQAGVAKEAASNDAATAAKTTDNSGANKVEALAAPSAELRAARAAPAAAPAAPPLSEVRPPASVPVPQVADTDFVSPEPSVRWRMVGPAVERTINGGLSWSFVSTGVVADLTAGAAASPVVCWLVGRGGVVLRTTNGVAFQRVPFPEMADLSAVQATDPSGRAASVVTADGRTFRTTDGGATWTQ